MKTAGYFSRLASATLAVAVIGVIGCASQQQQSHYQKAKAALTDNDYNKAIVEFTKAIDEVTLGLSVNTNEGEIAKGKRIRGTMYFGRGDSYLHLEKFDLALADYMKGLEDFPLDAMPENAKEAVSVIMEECRRKLGISNSQSTPAIAGNASVIPTAKAAGDELDMAIRDASDYLNDNIPNGSKIVILNIESNSVNLSEYIIDELIANVVNDKNFSVVDRRQIEAIQTEQKFQMSGAVDDKDALEIGKFFGAQTIISGAMRDIGGRYRLTIRALAVQTAHVQGQYNRNMAISQTLAGLANSGGSRPANVTVVSGASATAVGGTAASAAASRPSAPIQGTSVPGNSLTAKLEWLKRTVDSHNTYVVEVNEDDKIAPYVFKYEGAINVTVALVGVGGNRTIMLQSNGTMFEVTDKITFILDNNVTLMGHKYNNHPLVRVSRGGIFTMNGGAISGNDNSEGWGSSSGGGVVVSSGNFTMNNGTISGNTASYGGGVNVNFGTFTMNGGIISGNIAKHGGGVSIGGTFNMKGGVITDNAASVYGGGVNTESGTFVKTGGTITGYRSDPSSGNAVKDEDGNVINRKGHAVWANSNQRKEATSGPNSNLSRGGTKGDSGAWDL